MKTIIRAFIVATAVVAMSATFDSAQASGPYGGYGGYAPYYGPYANPFYSYVPTDRQIPYFAEFPPVYYSYPVPRTYGYSPYAYPPSFVTPDPYLAEPAVIDNPHAEEVAPGEAAEDKAASHRVATVKQQPKPKVIYNPYVNGTAVASAE